jgi:hypothetical protein
MKLSQHPSRSATKMLLLGDSGTGKTGALASLVRAGKELRILDFDSGLDILSNLLTEKELDQVYFKTLTDKMKALPSGLIIPDGQPKAWANGMKLLTKWDDEESFGNVADWPPEVVLVIDSLSFMSQAAMRHILFGAGRMGQQPWQSDWGEAQRLITSALELLYSSAVRCNVVITAHIKYIEDQNGVSRGYPDSLGRALPPTISRYFNTVCMAKVVGQGSTAKRVIRTTPDSGIGLKASAVQGLKSEYPLDTGLAEIFNQLQRSSK